MALGGTEEVGMDRLPATLDGDAGAQIAAMLQVVEDSVSSPSTKRNYRRALRDFLAWYERGRAGPLTRRREPAMALLAGVLPMPSPHPPGTPACAGHSG